MLKERQMHEGGMKDHGEKIKGSKAKVEMKGQGGK